MATACVLAAACKPISMQAIILGATGATGSDLLNILLNDDAFHRVDIFIRRSIDMHHPKLYMHVIDFNEPNQWKSLVQGDVLFSCLGTTLKTAGSKDAQWKVDYDYQLAFATAAAENKVPHYVLVSAAMASEHSKIFYSRMKGQLEEAVRRLGFEKLDLFRPPLLIRKDTDRVGEKIAAALLRIFNRMGLWTSQKPLPTEELAKAMVAVAKRRGLGEEVHANASIQPLAK